MAIVIGTNSGFVSEAPSADPGGSPGYTSDARSMASFDISPSGSYQAVGGGIWFDAASEGSDYELGLYSDDAVNVRPNVLLASSAATAKRTTAGWDSETYSSPYTLTASTKYWVAAEVDDTATQTIVNYGTVAGNKICYKTSQTALPATWGANDGSSTDTAYAIYALYEAAGGAADISVSTPLDKATSSEVHSQWLDKLLVFETL